MSRVNEFQPEIRKQDYMTYNGERYIFVKDIRGSVLKVVNSKTGEVAQELEYDDWGKVLKDTNPGFQPFGFAGGLYDYQTGLVRFGARDYDPQTGRFTSKDPILFTGGSPNLYSYVLNDPVNLIDPNGLWAVVIGGGFSGVFGGGTEGSAGFYFGTGSGGGFDFGFFGSGGGGFGLNTGADAFVGYFPGDTCSIGGSTTNYNATAGLVGSSQFFDSNNNYVGGTYGFGPSITPVGGSVSFSNTEIISIPGLFRGVGF